MRRVAAIADPLFDLKPAKLPAIRENHVENAVLTFLRLRGWLVKRQHVVRFQSRSGNWITIGERGDPDYVALHERWPAFALETKRPGAHATPHQIAKHDEYQHVWRIPVVVANSLEAIRTFLAEHERIAIARWANAAPGCDVRP